jgi:hypothetical protein
MQGFWAGFEKRAGIVRTSIERGVPLLVGIGAAETLSGLMHKQDKREGLLNKKEIKSLASKIIKAKGLKTKIVFGDYSMPSYAPEIDTVLLPESASAGSVAHELGHAASIGALRRSGPLGRAAEHATHGLGQVSHWGPTVTGAPLAGLLMAAPLLAEEASASVRAYLDLKKHEGDETARRAIPSLALGFGSHAAAPAVAGLYTHLLKQMK